MDDFIASVASQLGIDAATAKSATGKVLDFVKSKLGEEQFSQLASKIPGAADLASGAGEASGGGGGGMLGSLRRWPRRQSVAAAATVSNSRAC